MSKKKNKKFKKSGGAKTISSVQQAPVLTTNSDAKADNIESTPARDIITEKEKDEIELLNEKYLPIRKDVKKLLIVLAILAVLFVAIYFVGQKTTILTTIGDWLYKISNIQTQ